MVTETLKACVAASLCWAHDNAVAFDVEKTEALLLTRKRKQPVMTLTMADSATPGYKELQGNKQADRFAKGAACHQFRSKASEVLAITLLAYIARAGTSAKRQDRNRCLAEHLRPKRSYRRPKGNKAACKTKKAVAACFFQLRLQKAPTDPYALRTGRRADDKCWFCPQKPLQAQNHLFKTCRRWRNEQMTQWKAVAEATHDGGKRRRKTNTPIRDLLGDERCIDAVMAFLSTTSVRM
ncbi:hypothetical protein FN846DRAFT_994086 [Sphaerosporella brunnea]|uniref:Uncharacterized protein n=1 Tax=Sphaerosporella brunnea TaxID=1250544 RepID=A0A5J5F6J4_9PEZI|nr:hypothetical protein FN846DRAFT_994086 [Sphaerosporella brunnea]